MPKKINKTTPMKYLGEFLHLVCGSEKLKVFLCKRRSSSQSDSTLKMPRTSSGERSVFLSVHYLVVSKAFFLSCSPFRFSGWYISTPLCSWLFSVSIDLPNNTTLQGSSRVL